MVYNDTDYAHIQGLAVGCRLLSRDLEISTHDDDKVISTGF